MGHRVKTTCSSPTGCRRWLLFATVTLWLQVLGAPGLLQEGCGAGGGSLHPSWCRDARISSLLQVPTVAV